MVELQDDLVAFPMNLLVSYSAGLVLEIVPIVNYISKSSSIVHFVALVQEKVFAANA